MARPSKPISVQSRHNTKEEIEKRKEQEERLKGLTDKIKPPKHLTKNQKKIFKFIVEQLKVSGILSNLDIFMLTACAIAVDRINEIEEMINKEPILLRDKDLIGSKDKYSKEFFRCSNELALSPQARAKIAGLNLQAKEKEEDPVRKALKGDDDD